MDYLSAASDLIGKTCMKARFSNFPNPLLLGTAVLVSGSFVAPSLHAQDRSWTGTDGSWHDALNWNPSGVPIASDDVEINNGGSASIVGGNAFAQRIEVGWTGANNKLNVNSGAVVAAGSSFHTGYQAPGEGRLLLDGAGSALITPYAKLGFLGKSAVEITNGAAFQVTTDFTDNFVMANGSASESSLKIQGAGSILEFTAPTLVEAQFQMGSGKANLEVLDGGELKAPRWNSYPSGNHHQMIVSGADSTIDVGGIFRLSPQPTAPGSSAVTISDAAPSGQARS